MNLTFKKVTQEISPNKYQFGIIALLDNEQVGYLRFEVNKNYNLMDVAFVEKVLDEAIYLAFVGIDDADQKQGIATALYKEFGKIYKENYMGLPVVHLFTTPVAEYIFRKAIANGDIPVEAFNEEYFYKDDMQDEYADLWKVLREKLPEPYKGGENDWVYEEAE